MADLAMARAIEIFAAINLIAVGLSHALRPRAWQEFFALLHARGAAGNFFNAFLSLGMGSLIVAFHNVWSGGPTILTVYGWLSVVKGGLYLSFPDLGLRSMEKGSTMGPRKWVMGGIVLVLLGTAVLFFGVDPEPTLATGTGG